jgi:hypothetical protein
MTAFWPSEFIHTESKIIAPKKINGETSSQIRPACVAFQCVRPSIPFDEPIPVVVVVCGFHQDLSNQLFPWCLVQHAIISAEEISDYLYNIKVPDLFKREDQLKMPAGVDTYHFRTSVWKEDLGIENLFSLDIWVEESDP